MAESDHSAPDGLDDDLGAGQRRQVQPRRGSGIVGGLIALFAIYLFLAAINLMGGGLKSIAKVPQGKEWMDGIFACVDHPLAGLFVGLLVTSLVQSSSFTTTMVVILVGSGQVSLVTAIPIIMGANIGTSVTNILVSLAHVRQRLEFRRSFGAAVVHDFFNVLSVLLFLPLEHAFGIISRPAEAVSHFLAKSVFLDDNPNKKIGFLKTAFKALGKAFAWLLEKIAGPGHDTVIGAIVAGAALVLLFFALWMLVKLLRHLMQGRLSGMFDRTLFRNPATAFIVGIVITAAVQSSSVTTSLVVPLVAASILKLKQIYPYMLGANIGTTVTALLAALAVTQGKAPAIACAFAHLCFNMYGTVVFWPLQFIPISLAKGFAKIAARRRYVAGLFVLGFFILLPAAIILIKNLINSS